VEAVEVLAVFHAQGLVVEQGGCQLLEDLADYFPVGWAEVSAEGLAAREEQLIRNDVGERSQDVGMQLDLAKGRLDIICVRDNIEGRGVRPERVDTCEDLIFSGAE
jgi:hypothetical protein